MRPDELFFGRSVRALQSRTLRRLAPGLLLGVVPLFFVRQHLFAPGYPYLLDGTSNLYPALHVRWAIAHGEVPLYTHLWYGGEFIIFNPLFKGFYPPAWPLYVPGIPLLLATKAVLALHYLATPAVAYWFAREDFPAPTAALFALLFTTPMALFVGHYEKVFGWPWFVLLVWQVTPSRLFADRQRAGLLAGIGLGTLLLAGDNYHFFYAGILLGSVVLATKAWGFARRVALGALVGAPKLVFSIVPVLLGGPDRPTAGRGLTLPQFVAGLGGFWLDASKPAVEIHEVMFFEGYAVIGFGAVVVAALAVGYAYLDDPDRRRRAWILGVVAAASVGVLLASRWAFLYALPVVSMFRASARAMVLVAAGLLLLCWYGVAIASRRVDVRVGFGHLARGVVVALLLLSVLNGLAVWSVFPWGGAVETQVGTRVADRIEAAGCSSVWLEDTYTHEGRSVKLPYQKVIGFELTRRGVALQAVNYGRIGQEYSTHEDGELTFDALVVGERLPAQGNAALTGGWGQPTRGTVELDRLTLLAAYQTDRGPIYVYTTGDCRPDG